MSCEAFKDYICHVLRVWGQTKMANTFGNESAAVTLNDNRNEDPEDIPSHKKLAEMKQINSEL